MRQYKEFTLESRLFEEKKHQRSLLSPSYLLLPTLIEYLSMTEISTPLYGRESSLLSSWLYLPDAVGL